MTEPREQDDDLEPGETRVEPETVAEEADQFDEDVPVEKPAEEELPELTPQEMLRAERDEFQEKWLRVVAELDNVRKRSRREVVDARRFAVADVLRAFLAVLDNLERALQTSGNQNDTDGGEGLRQGIELTHQNFLSTLKDLGAVALEAQGAEFDPNFHEAVGQMEREGVEPGHVVEVIQQGYRVGDLVVRPARVMVSS